MTQIKANGITIEYDSTGDGPETVLLIMGLGAQMTRWRASLREKIAQRGFRVIWFDNRDVGLSTHFDGAVAPEMAEIVAARRRGEKPDVPYTLHDMAADAAGLLDSLGIARAHIVGASMGGMIAQLVAAEHADHTLSLTSIMSNTGNPELPQATPEAMAVLTRRAPSPLEDEAGFLDHSVASQKVTGSPAYPFDEADLRIQLLADAKRAYYPAGFTRQMAAITATGDRRALLKTVIAPTLVVHGAEDPLVPLPGGEDTALNIPGAELIVLPGVGHDLPTALDDMLADAIARNAQKARATA